MAAEIAETPAVITRAASTAGEWAPDAASLLRSVHGVGVIARGSSDHAGAYGRYLLEQALGVPCWTTAPSLVTRFGAALALDGFAAVAISQSGRTPEIVETAAAFRAAGARLIALTNDPSSPLADAAEVVVELHAGDELAVPATKTFTATLFACAQLAAACAPARFPIDAAGITAALQTALADADGVTAAVTELAGDEVIVHLGRGYLLPLATEAALKIIETSGTANLVWSTVDVRHGPMAMLGSGRAVVVHAVPGTVFADAVEIAALLRGQGARLIGIGARIEGMCAHVGVPGELAEYLQPLVHAVRVQQLALGLARARGVDPDHPSGLNKVTATR